MSIETGYQPHVHQLRVHRALTKHRFGVLVCHRRWGKTLLAISTLIDSAIRFQGKDGRFGYVAPYLKQAKQIAWLYLLRYGLIVSGTSKNESELFIEFPNGARITLYGADNAEAMRGLYLDGVVPDEMANFKPYVWGEIIRPALSDRKGWALFIGTPKGMNQFYELYQHALKDPSWYAGLFRADETDLAWLDEKELSLARQTMSENQYRQEFLCDFAASMDNILITIDQVSAAAKRQIRSEELTGMPKILAVDVARFGDDRSVIQKRQGLVAFPPDVFQGMNNMDLAARVAVQIRDWRPDAVFIDAGRGEGVIDRLRQLNHDVVEINFGGKPINPRYVNKRSEMWDEMAQWFRAGGAIPNLPEMKTDVCVPTYSFDAGNKLNLESKDKIKARGMRSPDLGDALALTFAMPVFVGSTATTQNHNQVATDYDPYA